MPSKKVDFLSIGGYSKFKNVFYLPPPPFAPSDSRSSDEEHDMGVNGNSCSYSELRGKMIFFLDISKHS